jgi:NADH-quinone oxidoreductase subunit A
MTLAFKYIPAILLFVMALSIPLIMLAIAGKTGPRQPSPRKMTPFECGVDSLAIRAIVFRCGFSWWPCSSSCSTSRPFHLPVGRTLPRARPIRSGGDGGVPDHPDARLFYVWKKGALEWE